jgi:diacylglycerol O-acyltransferase / wax synthase
MKRVHGMDTTLLALETATTSMHTISISVHAPREPGGALTFDEVRNALADRTEQVPLLWHRLVRSPLDLGPASWVPDAKFDIDRHLRRCRLSEGSFADLYAFVSEIVSAPLPRDRPLWELTFVEGLAGGRTAEILKLHHAISDGGKTVATLDRILFAEGAQTPGPHGDASMPSTWRVVRSVSVNFVKAAAILPVLLMSTLVRVARARWKRRGHRTAPVGVLRSRDVSFNARLSARRRFEGMVLPLERLRGVAETAGCSINDAFLAVCAGALRSYFQARHEFPARALVAAVPLALAHAPHHPMRGNRLSCLFADLATDEEDPKDRLQRIKVGMDAAKSLHLAHRVDIEQWLDRIPPILVALPTRIFLKLVRERRIPAPVNLVVSNVAGPDRLLYRCGCPVVAQWLAGPLLEGVGLNITAWSYQGCMHVGLLACPDVAIDLSGLAGRLLPALTELEQALARTLSLEPRKRRPRTGGALLGGAGSRVARARESARLRCVDSRLRW